MLRPDPDGRAATRCPDARTHRAVAGRANRQLAAAIDYVRDAVASDPDAAQNPLIAGAAQRHLAASILTAYPNTALTEPTAVDRHDSTPMLLGRAIAFIDDNARRDISLAEIAEAASVRGGARGGPGGNGCNRHARRQRDPVRHRCACGPAQQPRHAEHPAAARVRLSRLSDFCMTV